MITDRSSTYPEVAGRLPSSREQRCRRLLNVAETNLDFVAEDPRCLEPRFCAAFVELCEDKVLTGDDERRAYAEAAVELATRVGDRHLLNLSHGVLVHAHMAGRRHFEAVAVLRSYRRDAARCCPKCHGDWYRRLGDYLVERRKPKPGLRMLERAQSLPGEDLDDQTRARLLYVRSVAYHFLGDVDRALADAEAALSIFSLRSPRGFFHDAIAMIACFLPRPRARPRHDREALRILGKFRRRIKGLDGWGPARRLVRWVEGLLLARLGRFRLAGDRLDRVREDLLRSGPARYAVAVTADLAQIHARAPNELSLRAIRRMVGQCLTRPDLAPIHRLRLAELAELTRRRPEEVASAVARLRRSFVVPVPGLLAQPGAFVEE